eukprot:1159052-Pelagomonas_calceolata.AAC.1
MGMHVQALDECNAAFERAWKEIQGSWDDKEASQEGLGAPQGPGQLGAGPRMVGVGAGVGVGAHAQMWQCQPGVRQTTHFLVQLASLICQTSAEQRPILAGCRGRSCIGVAVPARRHNSDFKHAGK